MNNIFFKLLQVWIYEHYMNPSYQEVQPRSAWYVIEHHICTVGTVHIQFDGLTHAGVISSPHEDHPHSRWFELT